MSPPGPRSSSLPLSTPARPPSPGLLPRLARGLRRTTAVTAVGGLLLAGAPTETDRGASAHGTRGVVRLLGPDDTAVADGGDLALVAKRHPRTHRWKGHPGRMIRHYTVRRGDTATGLAVRFHAWTDELIALNDLGRGHRLYVGQRVRIPVVVAAARKARAQAHHRRHRAHRKPAQHRVHRAHHPRKKHARPDRGWRHADASRAEVRRVVARTAARHGVYPRLALAIAWQESGWQQRRISSAGAIGVMQVMPGTGRWMSQYAGRRLHLRDLHDNVTAGVMLLKVLRSQTAAAKWAMAGYYQGLASVRRYGMYPSTKHYVASVNAIRKRLRHGWDPA